MPMMNVGKVRMGVLEPFVRVNVRMRLTRRIIRIVCVLMVCIMDVAVPMRLPHMRVRVFVPLREVQPKPDSHEGGSDEEQPRHRVTPEQQSTRGSHEGRQREVRSGARGAE